MEIDLFKGVYPETKRDTKKVGQTKTKEQIKLAKEYNWEYFDKKGICYNGYNYDGSTSGNLYAKAMADTVFWNSHTGTGTVGNTDYPSYRNKSGFSGLPGGDRNDSGDYDSVGSYGYWWSSTPGNATSTDSAWYRRLDYNNVNVGRYKFDTVHGFSVRCVKD